MRRLLAAAAITLLVWGCLGGPLEPLPFQVAITANKTTAAPGDTVLFQVTAQGGRLIGVQIDYADGNTDEYNTAGARTATVAFKHAFQSVGTFLVLTSVGDDPGGIKGAAIQIEVN